MYQENSTAVQWLWLGTFTAGARIVPWLENWDPASCAHDQNKPKRQTKKLSVCSSHYYAILMFSFFFFKYLLIYLAVPALSCGIWGPSSLTRDWALGPLHWELGVIATGPPHRKSPSAFFKLHSRKVPQGPIVKNTSLAPVPPKGNLNRKKPMTISAAPPTHIKLPN